MNNPFTFEAEPFGYETADEMTSFQDQETWELGSPLAYEAGAPPPPVAPPLSAAAVARAVAANRVLARRIGWACVVGGQVRLEGPLGALLGLGAGATEEDIARAIAQWQRAQTGRPGDGQLGPGTWQRMLPQLRTHHVFPPNPRFKPAQWRVFARGRQIGVIDKTAAYSTHQNANVAGVRIELGFRVTDMDAVRRAGFVDGGEPAFRWIQVLELRTVFGNADPTTFNQPTGAPFPADTETRIQQLRRHGRGFIIDPTAPLLAIDPHPYYWDEGAENAGNTNRVCENGLCYTTRFFDRPSMPIVAARPGRRAYYNFETILVGLAGAQRNVLLNTVRWGFDIILVNGVPRIGVNVLHAGPTGGSPMAKHVLSNEMARGSFAGHCFVGGGFSRAATCPPVAAPVAPEVDELRGFPHEVDLEQYEEEAPAPQKMVKHVSCANLNRNLPIFRAIGTKDPVGVIEAACQRAVAMLDRTIGELTRIRERVRAGEPPVFPVLNDHVSWSLQTRMLMKATDPKAWTGRGPRTAEQILRWLGNIRKTLASGRLRYICLNETVCNRFGPTTWAAAAPNREFIILCRAFWRRKDGRTPEEHQEFQAQTLIHEVSHIFYETVDAGRGQGHAECISQFVADANGSPIDKDFAKFCGGLGPRRA
jgi:hypothetical protein